MVDIDSETLFNGAAAALTTLAVLFFILNVEFNYSPVSKVAIVFLFLALVLAISQRTDDAQLTLLGYGVVVVSVVGLFFEIVNTFNVGSELTVLGLLLLAAVLFALRTRFDDRNHLLTGRQAASLLGVVAVLAVVVLAVDVATGGLAYELQPESQIEIAESPREDLRVASVVVTNPTPLPERVETPNYAACAAGDWSEYRLPSEPGRERPSAPRVHLNVQDGYNEHVMSFGSKTYPVTLYLDAANATGETFRIEQTSSCPDDESGTPYIAIYERATDERRVYPV
ncbi:hypothetical protein D3D02_14850 [Halobellus sp. Atlit-38R]|uniref:hypothetical protein n=1 Tax=Halobellus sp. Atlit-38R TaxID=2282131 RepID=UPI000EF23538|nr:hypothetical protein [Halobellus sp. Atlit-38R]RLM84138.1 hypothetical protein D3D02_14850 [Halobellus sp. Atlit-38R]